MFVTSKIRSSIGLKSVFYFGLPLILIFIIFTQFAHTYVRKAAERDYLRNATGIFKVIKAVVGTNDLVDPVKFKRMAERIVGENSKIERLQLYLNQGEGNIKLISSGDKDRTVSSAKFVEQFQLGEDQVERMGETIEIHSPIYRKGNLVAVIVIQMSTIEERERITELISRLVVIGVTGVIFTALLMYALFRRAILNPIAHLENSTKKLASGDYEVVGFDRDDELGRLAKHFNRMLDILKLKEDENITLYNKLESSYKQARSQAITDELTGLYNYRYFRSRLMEEINRSGRNKSALSLAFIDIDDFKNFNDDYGHQIGDEALRIVADVIVGQIRSSDLAARYGGEELVIILPDTTVKTATVIAERIRTEVKKMTLFTVSRQLSVSIGIAAFPNDAVTDDLLIQKADKLMYEAKSRGKDQIVTPATKTGKSEGRKISPAVDPEGVT